MKKQILEDSAEMKITESEIEDLDFDSKEAISETNQDNWIEIEATCSSFKYPSDVTCCKLKK